MVMQLESPSINGDFTRDLTVVHFAGHKVLLDAEIVARIHEQLLSLADEPSTSDVLIDLGNVEYVSSAALGTLVSLHKKLLARGRNMTLANLNPKVYEVFAVTRLDTLLEVRLAGQEGRPFAVNREPAPPSGVLVVDDDAAVRSLLAGRLRSEGFAAWPTDNGQHAIELFKRYRNEIAVVLLDVVMPGMDGLRTLIALRRLCPRIRCCFMTENPEAYTEEALLLMGAVRVFRKPFAFAEVIDTLSELARGSRQCRDDRWIEIPWRGV